MTQSWFHWLRCGFAQQHATRTRRTSRPRRSSVPQLLVLEDRTVLSVLTVLNNADSGDGSLRAAIAAASSGDTIVFDPSLAYETITLSSGPLALGSNLTINGLGAKLLTISGNNASQLFTLSGSAQVTLASLTLTGGMSSKGGAIFIGGTAALTLDGDVLSGNQAVGDAIGNALGGAVYTSAGTSLTIGNTSFVNNQTNGTNESFGGAIVNGGTLSITGATFTGNAALGSTILSQGGAIGNQYGATATITLSTFTGNAALGSGTGNAVGGALANGDGLVTPPSGSVVTTTLSQCTFANNTATGGSSAGQQAGNGGAMEDEPAVNLTVLNCTFTGNQANSGGGSSAYGGAMDNSGDDTITISASQFISNSAIGSGVGAFAFAGAVDNFQTMTIDNCLFTGNSAVAGPMATGTRPSFGQAGGGAILTGGSGAILTLSNSIVAGNEAVGGSGGSTLAHPVYADPAFGGGINNSGTLNVSGCTITGNQAIGGASAQGPGGDAFGGGIRNDIHATLTLSNSTVSGNLCQAGAGASGYAGGIASGAGIDNERYSSATLSNSTISHNECLGGAGGAGANGGLAAGAAVANAVYPFAYAGNPSAWDQFGPPVDTSSVVVSNCLIVGNTAQGGTAGSSAVGGDGLGGGIFVGSGTAALKGVLVSGNQAHGGVDSQQNTTGQGLGGGVYVDPSATVTAMAETIITGNHASKSNDDVFGTINPPP
jgi:hypothetical protein